LSCQAPYQLSTFTVAKRASPALEYGLITPPTYLPAFFVDGAAALDGAGFAFTRGSSALTIFVLPFTVIVAVSIFMGLLRC
jgi:hypothetical protein